MARVEQYFTLSGGCAIIIAYYVVLTGVGSVSFSLGKCKCNCSGDPFEFGDIH